MRSAKTRVFAFLTLVILTAVFSASALTASNDQATLGESGSFAANTASFFGFNSQPVANVPASDATSGCDTAPAGMLACYRGDLDASDTTGAHNGEWIGTYGYADGKVGAGAFNFNGKNRIVVPNAADLNPENVTVDGWVNLADVEASFGLISKGDAYSLGVVGGKVVFTSRNAKGVAETLRSSASLKAGTWTHIAATHDGAMRRIYVDGKEVESGRQAGLSVSDESGLAIGSTTSDESSFTALADEVKVFGRALTAKEIGKIAGGRIDAPEDITVFSVTPSTVVEGNQVLVVSVTRAAPNTAGAISVNFAASGGLATGGASCAAGIDYVFGTPSVGFVGGEVGTKTVLLNICADTLAEGTETFNVTASIAGPGDVITAMNPVVVTITDDDMVTLMASAPVNEGTPGAAGQLTYTLNRGAGAANPGPLLSVPFTMTGTAITTGLPDVDYTQTGGTCTNIVYNAAAQTGTAEFAANSTAATCTVVFTASADDVVETNQTAVMTVALPLGLGTPGSATGTINNDDLPWISVAVVGTSTSLLTNIGAQLVEEGTPQAGGSLDYTYTRGMCSAATPGNPTVPCPGAETSALVSQTANVIYAGTALPGTDFTIPGATVSFGGTVTSATLSINPTDEIVVEIDETIIATITAAAGYNVDGNTNGGFPLQPTNIATGYINDDDEDVSITVAPAMTLEDTGADLVYTFARTALSNGANEVNGIDPRADAINVIYTVAGTATNGTDYATITSPLAIPGGAFSGNLNVNPTTDAIPENNETVILTVVANGNVYGVGSPNATPGTSTVATGTITNDDFQVIITGAVPAQTTEDGATNLVYTFTRIGASAPIITANFNTSGSANPVTGPDFAVLGATTYVGAAIGNSLGTINIPNGTTTTVGGVDADTAQLTVDPTADTVVETDENVLIQVDNGIGYTPGTPAQANGVIQNDDTEVSIAVAPNAADEDAGPSMVYTFTRTGAPTLALTVNYTTTGTATAGTDYIGTNAGANTVVFAAGQGTATVTVDPTADSMVEPDETVILTINAGTGYTIAAPSANAATGTILNDDAAVSVAVAPATVAEGNAGLGAPLVYTFTRTGVLGVPLTVNYTIAGTAINGTDYTAIGTSVPFAIGQATATVNVTPIGDLVVEADETVIITVVNGTGYSAIAPMVATGTITNDDTDIVCTGPVAASVNENSGSTMTYTCVRTGVTATAASIPFTLGGTATFTTDYVVAGQTSGVNAAGGTLNFAAAGTTATVVVTPVADFVVEPDETVVVGFATGVGFNIVPSPTNLTGTITNDDTDVSVTVAPASVTENGVPNLVYTFTRNTSPALLALSLTVNFSTTGSATSGTDYTQTSTGSITFAAGMATATMTVDPTGDAIVEPDETVIITITAGTGYTAVAPTAATGTILNDDTSYTITALNSPVTEHIGNGGLTAPVTRFRVSRNGANSPAGQVDVATIPGSGTATAGPQNTVCAAGQDYTSDGETVVFAAGGDTFFDFDVTVCGDLTFELPETFDAALSNPVGGFIGVPALATMTINDDDNAPTLTINDIAVNENAGTATLTVTLSPVSGLNTTFNSATVAVTATANADYTSSTAVAGTIPAGQTTTTVVVPIIDDNLDEPDETFNVVLSSPVNAVIGTVVPAGDGLGVVTILDNEQPTSITINDVAQAEGTGIQNPGIPTTSVFNFTITRVGDAQAAQVVCFDTADGDLANINGNPNPAFGGPFFSVGVDYTTRAAGAANCVTFTQGGPSAITVPVVIHGDDVFEFDESFTVRLLSASNAAVIADGFGLGTILNDDLAPSVSIAGPANILEGNPPTNTNRTFTVTRTGNSSIPVTVSFATADGTATGGASCSTAGVDYITTSGTVVIPAGPAPQTNTITVQVCGDLLFENNETFTVTISNPISAVLGTPASATYTILDDDATPIISVSDVTVAETNSGTTAAVFTITRTNPSALTSVVTFSTVDGSATTANLDYVGQVAQTVTFLAGETTRTVTVTVNGDLTFESDETFTLQVTNATNAFWLPGNGGDPVGLGTITNDDGAPTFALGPVTQNEGTSATVGASGPFFVRLTRTGTTQLQGSVTFSTTTNTGQATSGTACTGTVDFNAISAQTLIFPAAGFTPSAGPPAQGANFIDIPVQVCQDATFEPNETFNLVLNSAVNGQISPTGGTALVTITNDDGLAFAIRNPGPEGAEGNAPQLTNFNFTIDRIGDASGMQTVCYQTVAGTATEGTDYTGLPANAMNCVNFAVGVTAMNVPVSVIGDAMPEADETFFLRIISATAGTFPAVGTGDRVATINNDDGPIPVANGIEGDVVDAGGTPAGEGMVLANDVTAIRQFALGNAVAVTTPNQFQRGDINGTCGDGAINAADVTVVRLMVLGTVIPIAACGPTTPIVVRPTEASKTLAPEVVGRIIRAVSTTSTPGALVTVSFQLDSQGDEASASYTVNWDASRFTFVSAALGAGVPTGASLGTNITQTAQGRLGVLVDSTNAYAQGTRQMVTVTFMTAANAPASTNPVTFSSVPTAQSVSSTTGVILATTYETGNIVIMPTAAGVRVSGRVTTAGGQGLRNATVVITDSEGNRRTAVTSTFGIYTFDDVEAGQSYVMGVSAKRFRFASRVVNVTDSLADVNFVGQE